MPGSLRPRILVVDDDMGVISAYRHVLEGDDYTRHCRHHERFDGLFDEEVTAEDIEKIWRVEFVDQGEAAVQAIVKALDENDPFAVVFLDIIMPPGMDGYETAEQIRKIDPNVHIVFVSGYSYYTAEDLVEVAGPVQKTSLLMKPVWPDRLKSTAIDLCSRAVADAA